MFFLDRRAGFEATNRRRALAFGEGRAPTSRHLSLVARLIQPIDTERKANVKRNGKLLFQIPLYLGKEIPQAKLVNH